MDRIIGQCGKYIRDGHGNIVGEEGYNMWQSGRIMHWREKDGAHGPMRPVDNIPAGDYDWGWGLLPSAVHLPQREQSETVDTSDE